MLRLAEIYLSDPLADKLLIKCQQYNEHHPEDTLTTQQFAEMLIEFSIRYLDVSALD